MNDRLFETVKNYFLELQDSMINAIEELEPGKTFYRDEWDGLLNGHGISCIMEGGQVIEKGGINFSSIQADALPPAATEQKPHLAGLPFMATGISMVFHPQNPYIPTSHANLRFFCIETKSGGTEWWFGGGFDLTPYYAFEEDCRLWHQHAYEACAPHGDAFYQELKEWADRYFLLKHRKENRGIGGLFFDELNRWDFETVFAFVKAVGQHYQQAYLTLIKRRMDQAFGEREKNFQLYRRGRYVEFNLLYDRGTHFGLQSGGRVESILMSLPPHVSWKYNYQPEKDTPEFDLTNYYLKPRDWLNLQQKETK